MTDIAITSVCSYEGIKLTKRGDKFVCLCPFHPDKNTPSLTIYPQTNSFYCFGCSKGGDVFEFIKLLKDINFAKAKTWLDENFGCLEKIELPDLTVKEIKHAPKIKCEDIQYWHSLIDLSDKREYWLNRGFTNQTIDKHLLGYNGQGYIIPIWESEPQNSNCLAYKIRYLDDYHPKYVKIGNLEAKIYNHYYCEYAPTILAFAGELDCLRAVQDGLPAFSVVDGKNSWKKFPQNWPIEFFPNVCELIVCFDRHEEISGAQMAEKWEKIKGKFSTKLLMWPPFEGSDYCDWRQNHSVKEFENLIEEKNEKPSISFLSGV